MLKILVFDGGRGGQLVTNYLAEELNIAEVESVIDWEHAPYSENTLTQICHYAEKALQRYIGKVDLIVLGGYTASYALDYLKEKYPKQKFVGMDVNYHRILKSRIYPSNITVMMSNTLINTQFCEVMRRKLPFSTLVVPDCTGWEDMINSADISADRLRGDLEDYFELAPKKSFVAQDSRESLLTRVLQEKYESTANKGGPSKQQDYPLIHSDVVLLLNTTFWEVKEDLERIFGYGVRVLDFRQKLLHDVCTALDLLGVDGRRSK